MNDQTLYLIDGHSLTFKAYYAIRNLRSPSGAPTGAVYGFLRMLLRFIDQWSPRRLAVVFDTGKPTFRKDLYPDYKANREAPPEDFSQQMEWIIRLLAAMGIPVYSMDGFEADDVIATMAERMRVDNGQAVVLSADKDLLQLVDERIKVLRPGLNEMRLCDSTAVQEILGVRPDQVVDWLSLVGDSSDNIPGVPGIGEKTAIELLRQHQTLEALIEKADSLTKPRLRQSLKDNAERARLARELATVRRDVPVAWDLAACCLPDNLWSEPAISLLIELGFESILKERGIDPSIITNYKLQITNSQISNLESEISDSSISNRKSQISNPISPTSHFPLPTSEAPVEHYDIIMDEAALARWVEAAMKAPWLALDTETTSTDTMNADLVGLSFSFEPGRAIYIPVGHQQGLLAEGTQLSLAAVRDALAPLLAGKGPRLSGHNAKYDWKVLRRAGFNLAPPAFDTMIASYLLDPDKGERGTGHGLKTLGREFCAVTMSPISDLIGTGRKAITMAEVAIADAGRYAARDADVTLRLTEVFRAKLAEFPKLQWLMDEVELPLMLVLMEMEEGGFNVDVAWLRSLGGEVSRMSAELAQRIVAAAGEDFNIASTRQVARILYEKLGLPTGKQGKTGYSTDEAELERLAPMHIIPRLILDYRGYEKLKSTYIEALPRLVNQKTGRLHTSFNQTIAATGRLTSTDPNLQNIPIRTELGRAIRRAFVADEPGHELLKVDYSQIELRILAHVSQDQALCAAYREGRDIHRQTASEIFAVKPEEVTSQMRAQAKTINFGVIYGMSAHGLAQQLGIGRAEAGRFIDRYFQSFPRVRQWMDRLLEQARQTGYVETLLGRRRLVPDLTARNGMIRSAAERIAINAPIQGTSADMIKLAMIRIQKELQDVAPGARMVCQVHDELVFSVPRNRLTEATGFIRRTMVEALPLSVAIEVEATHAANWAEC